MEKGMHLDIVLSDGKVSATYSWVMLPLIIVG